jgi:hypothetical protein
LWSSATSELVDADARIATDATAQLGGRGGHDLETMNRGGGHCAARHSRPIADVRADIEDHPALGRGQLAQQMRLAIAVEIVVVRVLDAIDEAPALAFDPAQQRMTTMTGDGAAEDRHGGLVRCWIRSATCPGY